MNDLEERYFVCEKPSSVLFALSGEWHHAEGGWEMNREQLKEWLDCFLSFRDYEVRKATIKPRTQAGSGELVEMGPFTFAQIMTDYEKQKLERSVKNEMRFGKVKKLLGVGL